jgi:hypothetical protein
MLSPRFLFELGVRLAANQQGCQRGKTMVQEIANGSMGEEYHSSALNKGCQSGRYEYDMDGECRNSSIIV